VPPETPYVLRRLRLPVISYSLAAWSPVLVSLLNSLRFFVRSRAALHLEVLALRHQSFPERPYRWDSLRFLSAVA
jgi:hypothetical protein